MKIKKKRIKWKKKIMTHMPGLGGSTLFSLKKA